MPGRDPLPFQVIGPSGIIPNPKRSRTIPEISEPREYTKVELAAIYAHFKSKFTVEDLLGYIEDNEPVIPADESLRQLEARS